jgi:FixJ family two-component response regulator
MSAIKLGDTGLSTKSLVAIIDDDEYSRAATTDLVKSLGFAVQDFTSALDFLASPHLHNTACLITDINMPRMTGIELYSHLVKSGYRVPTILLTAYPDDSVRADALAQGVICYLTKPCDDDHLLECVEAALKHAGAN